MQSFNPYPGIRIRHERFQHGIPHLNVILHIRAEPVQGFQPHSGIRVVPQRIHQSLAHVRVIWLLGQNAHRIHPQSRIEVVARRIQKQLLDVGIIHRPGTHLGRNGVVLHRDLVRSRLLLHRLDRADRSQQSLAGVVVDRRQINRRFYHLVSGADAAGESDDKDCRRQSRRKANLVQPGQRIEYQTMPPSALLGRFQRFLQLHSRCRQ